VFIFSNAGLRTVVRATSLLYTDQITPYSLQCSVPR